MAFDKKPALSHQERESFDLDNDNDRRIVRDFEKDSAQCFGRKKEVFGKALTGFDLYLEEQGLFRYSNKYPDGAVNHARLFEYRMAIMKITALRKLWDRRDEAEKEERRVRTLIPEPVMV